MRVLIMADMEGVSGLVHWDQVTNSHPMYAEGRRLFTEEINAAIRGAKKSGAKEIVVVDGHGAGAAALMGGPAFNSLIPELLDADCEFVTHHGWANYTQMFEEGCDACFFVGIHSMGGTPNGVMSHTISSTHWYNIFINDVVVGEIGVVAALAGAYGVPMVLVTGDDKACQEASALLGPEMTTVAVKRGLSRYSARNIAPLRARMLIEDGAARAVKRVKKVKPYLPGKPTTVKMEIVTADAMDPYRRIPGVQIIEPRTVVSRGKDFLEAWNRVSPYK
jgi:D-amino peptidase